MVRRRRKDGGPGGLSESGEVSHNLMPPQNHQDGNGKVYGNGVVDVYGNGKGVVGGLEQQPLPPPPTPTQWSHMYSTTAVGAGGGAASCYTDSSHYDGNQYEVPQLPHHHGGKTPAPSLRYGFSGGYPADGGGHIYIPQHVMPVYYPDNRPTV